MTKETPARRVYPNTERDLILAAGDYGKDPRDGVWYVRAPGTTLLGSLANHEVMEHDDGTITAAPSIRIRSYAGDREITWHGYLQRGVWKEC